MPMHLGCASVVADKVKTPGETVQRFAGHQRGQSQLCIHHHISIRKSTYSYRTVNGIDYHWQLQMGNPDAGHDLELDQRYCS